MVAQWLPDERGGDYPAPGSQGWPDNPERTRRPVVSPGTDRGPIRWLRLVGHVGKRSRLRQIATGLYFVRPAISSCCRSAKWRSGPEPSAGAQSVADNVRTFLA